MKKHCKQALSALLTIAMVLSMLIVPSSAATPKFEVSSAPVEVKVDETVDVTYTVTGDTTGVYVMSDDTAVATVTVKVAEKKVAITGVAEGEATVYVVASDTEVKWTDADKAAATQIKVTVKPAEAEVPTEWNFRSGSAIMGTTNGVTVQGGKQTWQGLEIDATTGKFDSTRNDWAQTNTGLVIKVPVTVGADQHVELTLNAYNVGAFTVDGVANTKGQAEEVFACTGADGFVTIKVTTNSYLGSIKVAVVDGALAEKTDIEVATGNVAAAVEKLPTVGGDGADKDSVVVKANDVANTKAGVKTWVEDLAKKAIGDLAVEATVDVTAFTAAVDGTKADPDGTDGSFKATITLAEKAAGQASLAAAGDETIVVEGVIKANAYVDTDALVDAGTYDYSAITDDSFKSKVPGITFDGFSAHNGHGPVGKTNASITVNLSAAAVVTITGCRYGKLAPVQWDGKEIAGVMVDESGANAPVFTLSLPAGKQTIVFTNQDYIHSVKVDYEAAKVDSLALPTSVEVEEEKTATVSAVVVGYEGKTLYAFSETPATATVTVKDTTITVTGVKAGETTVYAVMADTAPADYAAAKAAEGSKGFAVTVTPKPVAPVITTKLEDGTYDFYNLKGTNEENQAVQDAVKGVDWGGALPLKLDNKHGVNNAKYKGNYITFYVPDNCMANITVTTCCYGTGGNVKINGEAATPSSYVEEEGNAKVPVYTMTLVEGAVKFEFDGTLYVPKLEVKIVEKVEPMPDTGKIDVWDFGAEKLDETKFNNHLTVEKINGWYPEGTEAGAKSKNIVGFVDPTGLVFEDGGYKTNHRLRTTNTAITRWDDKSLQGARAGGVGNDPYVALPEGEDARIVYTGYIYSNKSSTDQVYLALKGLCEGDIVTFMAGSNSGPATYTFEAPDGSTQTAKFTMSDKNKAEALTFYPGELGTYRLYTLDEKLVVPRIYRAPAKVVGLSGKVIISKDAPADYELVFTDKMTGNTTKAELVRGATGTTYTADIFAGHDYELSLIGADEYVIEKDCQTVSVAYEGAPADKNLDITIQAIPMVSVTGTVTGLTKEFMAKALLNFTAEKDALYVPKPVKISDAGEFVVRLEDGMSYMLAATGINDYEITSDTTGILVSSEKPESLQQTVTFQKKQVYKITIDTAGTIEAAELKDAVFTFYKLDEAGPDADQFTNPYNPADFVYPYTYEFTGTENIELRAGTYALVVTNLGAPEQLATPNLVVKDKAETLTVKFDTTIPSQWVFSDADYGADDTADGNYKGLVLDKVKDEKPSKGHAIVQKGGKVAIPVSADAKAVEVEFYYTADAMLGNVPVFTESKSTSKYETAVYTIPADTEWVYLINNDTTNTYLTKITVFDQAYEATLKVGADKPYKTINAALDAVAGMYRPDGERVTIEIDPGNYEEYVVVNSANVTFKNAAGDKASIMTKNKGVDIEENAVRITWYYGHGYDYYSMASDYSYDADVLAANKANGSFSTHNPGSGTGTMWNASVIIAADGFQAEGIIFENSFNQYVSAASVADVIVSYNGAKEGTVPRAEMKTVGDTKLQEKEYVERAGALSIKQGSSEIVFNHCAFISRQDTLYGHEGSKVAFYDCDVYGGTDYIYGGMTAVFAKCDLIFNTNDQTEKGRKDDVGYITAPQQKSTDERGYLMYNCTVKSTTPGVNTASTMTSKPGTFGRPWAADTGEAVFFETKVETTNFKANADDPEQVQSLIQPTGWLNTLSGESARCGEYHTHETGRDMSKRVKWATVFTAPETADGAKMADYKAWLGGWDPFTTMKADMTITGCDLPAGIAIKDKDVIYMIAGDVSTTALVAEVTDCEWGTAADKTVTWTTEDEKVATVDADGKITAVAPGKTAIVAAAKAANEFTDSVDVYVDPKAVESVSIDQGEAVTVKVSATTALTATVLPAGATDPSITWSSDKADIASVDSATGVVTGVKAGTAVITVTTTDGGKTDTITVNVIDTAALEKAAADAEKAMTGIEGIDAASTDEVDTGVKYVPTAVKAALEKAITDAKTAVANAKTQAELDAAKAALDKALKDFNDAVKTGTKPAPVVLDTKALEDAIAAADKLVSDTRVIDEPVYNVSKDTEYVTTETMNALKAAVEAAKEALKNATTQAEIDAAVTALNDAVKAFNDAKLVGTKRGGGGGGSYGGGTADNKNVFGDTVKTTSNRNGKTITVTRNGKVIAKVEIPKTIPEVDFKFTDVPDDHWAADDIYKIAGLGLINGVSSDGHVYDMNTPLTRGSLAAILYRLAQGNATGLKPTFTDVAEDAWYADAIAWAAEYGIVKGYSETTFGPDDPITREQLGTMLYRFAQLLNLDMSKTTALSSFVDGNQVSDWAATAMSWDVGTGIIKGKGANDLVPLASATRAEAATMLGRFIGLV